jgi:predicted PurR-regulated permease PerM
MQVESTSIRFSPQAKVIAIAIIVGLAVLLLTHGVHILTPFIAAIITAYLFHPLVSLLQWRTGIGRAFWIIVLSVLAFSLRSWLGTWVWPRIVSQSQELSTQLPLIIDDVNRAHGGRERDAPASKISHAGAYASSSGS